MVSIQRDLLLELIKSRSELYKQWEIVKRKLISLEPQIKIHPSSDVKTFYNKLCDEIKRRNFITLNQLQIGKLKNVLGVVPSTGKTFEFQSRSEKFTFSKLIILAMGYNDRRSDFYPGFYSSLGINACVYCNAQYTLSDESENGNINARYELDHVEDKAAFPYLSITLFNLVPICSSCNRKKHTNRISFRLYSKSHKASDYKFKLTSKSKVKYLLNPSKEHLEIDLEVNDASDDSIEKRLSVKSLYQTQRDLAEEIVVKSKIYNASYRSMLNHSFSRLKLGDELKERIILGTYYEEKDIHKRPMTKFSQDIAIDIGFLKR